MTTKKSALFITIWILTILAPLRSIIFGGIPFWSDPARDLLLAVANLSKMTLLGVPTGLPGVNYGPYWVWLLSISTFLSFDPRLASFLILAIPFLFILPLVLLTLPKHIMSREAALAIWVLLIVNFEPYATFIWNPHLVPFFFVCLFATYVWCFEKPKVFNFLLAGFLSGLVIHFGFGFGAAVLFSSFMMFLLSSVISKKLSFLAEKLSFFLFFLCGTVFAFLPTFLFEYRHGFNQVKLLFSLFENSFIYKVPTVGLKGLTPVEILASLTHLLATTFSLPSTLVLIMFVFLLGFYVFKQLKTKHRLIPPFPLGFCLTTLLAVLFLLFSSKNPVWDYHTIGLETVFLLCFGMLVTNVKYLSKLFLLLVVLFVLFPQVFLLTRNPIPNFKTIPSLTAKEAIITDLVLDAKTSSYHIAARNPAIYTYDFDYLTLWKARLNHGPSPLDDADIVYLILPDKDSALEADFTNYKTPKTSYTTDWSKIYPDGTKVLKRLKK